VLPIVLPSNKHWMGRTAGSHLQRITYALRPYPHQSTPTYPLLAVCQEETQMPQHQQSTKLRLRLFPSWVLFGFRFRAAAAAGKFCESVDKVAGVRYRGPCPWPEANLWWPERAPPKSDYPMARARVIFQPEEGPKIWLQIAHVRRVEGPH